MKAIFESPVSRFGKSGCLLKPLRRTGKRKTLKLSSLLRHFAQGVGQEQHSPQHPGDTPLSRNRPRAGKSHLMPGSAIGEPPCSRPARCYGAAIRLSREHVRFVAAALLIASAAGLLFLVVTVCPATTLATPHSLMTTMMAPAPIIAFIAGDRIVRHFGPREKTLLAALWSMALASRNVAPVSLIPLGVPVTLAVFILILRRSEHFAAPVAFSTASAKMTARRHDIAPLQS
jgi:hypothetical protein